MRSDWEREDFTNDNLGTRTLSGGKEENINANESNQAPDCVLIIRERHTNGFNYELADDHSSGSLDEHSVTAGTPIPTQCFALQTQWFCYIDTVILLRKHTTFPPLILSALLTYIQAHHDSIDNPRYQPPPRP